MYQESIETINDRLKEFYGVQETGQQVWRVVWSDDQFENRYTDTTDAGVVMLFPKIERMRKYEYIRERYILEQIVIVPEFQQKEIGAKISYEPIHVFENAKGPLPVKWEAIEFLIYSWKTLKGQNPAIPRYLDPRNGLTDPAAIAEEKDKRLKVIMDQLFGNETDVSDALTYKEGIVVPNNYGDNKS